MNSNDEWYQVRWNYKIGERSLDIPTYMEQPEGNLLLFFMEVMFKWNLLLWTKLWMI